MDQTIKPGDYIGDYEVWGFSPRGTFWATKDGDWFAVTSRGDVHRIEREVQRKGVVDGVFEARGELIVNRMFKQATQGVSSAEILDNCMKWSALRTRIKAHVWSKLAHELYPNHYANPGEFRLSPNPA